MVRHAHAGRRAETGDTAPVGDAAALGHIVIHEIDGAGIEQPARALRRDLALARGDRHANGAAHARHQGRVVVPVARLLEPRDIEMLDQPGEANRIRRAPAAIGIHAQHEIGARGPARDGHSSGVVFR